MKRTDAFLIGIMLSMLLMPIPPSLGQEISSKGSVSLSQRRVTGISGQRQFNLQFRPADTAELYTGSVRVTGAEGFAGGSLGDADWSLDGNRLSGKIVQRGMTVVTFEGTVGAEETTGTFTTAGGRMGEWTSEGNPPSSSTE